MASKRRNGPPPTSFLSKEIITNLIAIGGVIFAVLGAYFGVQGTLTQHTEQIKTAATKQERIEAKVNDIDKNVALIQQAQGATHDALKEIFDKLPPGVPKK